MLLALGPPVVFAQVGQLRQPVVFVFRVTERVATKRFFGQHVERHALDPRRGAHETLVDDLVTQPQRLEDLGPLVRLQRADAHLGHHLQHALGDGLSIRRDDLVVGHRFVHQPVADRLPQRLERQVGVDRVGPVADQQTEVVDLTGLAGLDDQPDSGAFAGLDQVVVDRPGGQQRRNRHAVLADVAVGQHDQLDAGVDGRLGFGGDPVQRRPQTGPALGAIERDVDDLAVPTLEIDVRQRRGFFVGQDRVRHQQPVAVFRRRGEQVLLRPDVALQRHHDFLADRIDRGVGDLREQLLEIVVDHPRLIGQHGQRAVVAHRTDRVAGLFDQRPQHELQRLHRVTERLHPRQQRLAVETVRLVLRRKVGQQDALITQPLPVRHRLGELALEFLVRDQPAFLEVDQEHLARLQPTLRFNDRRIDR